VAEANVRGDVNALRKTLGAGWRDVLLTPLDTCGQVELRGELYKPIWAATGDGLLRAVIENYCIWVPRVPWLHCDFFAQRSTTLFDCVAVYLAYAEELLEIETMKFDITDEGFTIPAANGKYSARVALRWRDRAAFENHLSARLQGGCP
jgi:inosine-uridine nucleoside N-ribohydrolase